MDLSVVIPAKNSAADLGAQLDALLDQAWSGEWEIVVADNASTDGTVALVAEYSRRDARVRFVDASGGHGANFARTVGARAARADHLAFADSDDIVGPRWVATMGDALRSHQVVTGPIEVDLLNPPWLTAVRGRLPVDRPRTQNGAFTLVAGGNVGIHRSVWESIGGFAEDAFGGGEDLEFSLRLHAHGVAPHFAPDAILHYRYRSEPRALFRQGRFYGRGKPLIGRLLHDAGLPGPSRLSGWKSWLTLFAWLPRLRTREGRAAWCWVAGSRLGQLEGIVHHRAFWL